jgi:hypothetical protein
LFGGYEHSEYTTIPINAQFSSMVFGGKIFVRSPFLNLPNRQETIQSKEIPMKHKIPSKTVILSILLALFFSAVGAAPAQAAGLYTHSKFVQRAIQRLEADGRYSELLGILNSYPGIVNYGAMFPDTTYGGVDGDYAEGLHDTGAVNDRYTKFLQFMADNGYDKNDSDLQTNYYTEFLKDPNYAPKVPTFRRALMGQLLERFRNNPRSAEDEKMIAFLFGLIAHQEADMAWHWKDLNWLGLEEYAFHNGYSSCGFLIPDLNNPEICLDVVLRNFDNPDKPIDTTYLSTIKPIVLAAGDVAGVAKPKCNGRITDILFWICSSPYNDPFVDGQDQINWLWDLQATNFFIDFEWWAFVYTYVPGGIDYGSAFVAGAWMEAWDIFSNTGPFYVKPGGDGNCLDWENACELRYALNHSIPGQEVWVAAGVYKPTSVDTTPTDADRKATFQLLPDVYGGFAGMEIALDQRDPAAHPTILSGDIDNNDVNTDGNNIAETSADIVGNNSYHVVTGASGATLDRFTVTAGNANGDAWPGIESGGGMLNLNTFPTVTNVTFSGNAASSGGGMFNWTSTIITNNGATIMNVTFSGNSATANGGGMYNELSRPKITNATFKDNSAGGDGGGMFNHTQLINTDSIRHVTFSGNHAEHAGGAVYNYYGAVNYYNTIFWGNTATSGSQAFEEGAALGIFNSVVQGGCPANVDCAGIITDDPLLGNLGDYGGWTPTIPIQEGSSAIDAGGDASCPQTDQRGLDRPQREHCDIGAFELGIPAVSLSTASHDFGNQLVGTTSGAFTITLTNTGTDILHVGTLSITGQFALSAETCNGAAIFPNGTCVFDVTFSPLSTSAKTGSVSIPSDAPSTPDSVSLSGTGVDTIAPTLIVPANMTVEATGPSGAVVNFTVSASDNYDPSPPVTCDPPSGSTFPLGITTVKCSAQDTSGNIGTNSFTITVLDTTAPVVTVPANMIVEATGPGGRVVSFSTSATDTVAPLNPAVTCVAPSGSTFPLGVNTVNCSATDTAGNTGTNSFTITVRDTTPPVVTLPTNMTVSAPSAAGAVVTFTATATDTVAPLIPVVTCVPPSGSTFPLGVNTVNCSATDTAGNTANGSFTIHVIPATSLPQLLKMPTFDKLIAPIPWTVKLPTIPFASVRDCTVSLSPNCSVKFVGKSTNPLRYAEQSFIRRGNAGDKFYIGLSSRAENVPTTGLYKVEVFFYDLRNRVVGSQALNFSFGTHDWETLSTTYIVPAAYYRVAFRFTFQNTAGTAWFDNAFLVIVP